MLRHDDGYKTLLGLHGSCELLRIDSRALQGNGLGDPAVRHLPVYIPPDGSPVPEDGFPTLYFLPSYAADARGVLAPKAWEPCLFQRIDRLIAGGAMRPVIIVAVDGWTRLGGSQYVNSPQNGRHADYLLDEVMPAVEAALPARGGARSRGLFGTSSGGFGALHIALRHPGRVGAIAAHSADGYFPYCTQGAFIGAFRELRNYDFDFAAFTAKFEHTEKVSPAQFEAMITLAYAAAYSPRSAEPFDIALPFSQATGEIDQEIFAQWLAFDPVQEVRDASKRRHLSELALCYLDCGDRDEYGLDIATRLIAKSLADTKPCVYEEFSGGHRGNAARYDRSLVLLSDALYRAR